jgi:glycogen(starch) synthase
MWVRALKSGLYDCAYLVMWFLAHGLFCRSFEPKVIAWSADVIHAHDGLSLPLLVQAAQKSKALSVFDSHELEAHRNHPLIWAMRGRITALERRYLPQINAVLTVSESIADHLCARYAIARPTVLLNSPPLMPAPLPSRWQGSPRETVRIEAELGTDALLLVYTGNIAAGRGIEQTLAGLAHLLDGNSGTQDIHLSLVGNVLPTFKAQLLAQAERLGLHKRVRFHPSVPATDVSRFVADADIAVLPILPDVMSHQYAMPNKLFEALQAGLPILGANLEEMSEFIRRHDLGACYDPFSAQSFCEGLETILHSSEGTASRRVRLLKISEHYSWEVQGDKLVALYESFDLGVTPARVAMVVPNPCDPDYRVVKQAQTLATSGYQVKVFCTLPAGSDLPVSETINGVEYERIAWSSRAMITPRWLR